MENDKVLTPLEVAEVLRIAKNTVYELVKRGELKAYRVGKKIRFNRADIDAYQGAMRPAGDRPVESPLPASYVKDQPDIPSPPGSDALPAGGFVLCGQDIILDTLARRLETHPSGSRVLRSYMGSYNGMYALYQGTVHAATAHLWDGDSGEYNLPYIRRLLPGVPAVVIRLAGRSVGFYVQKGNPKSLTGWDDLARSDLSMVNRERGSGIRVLIDERLRKMGLDGRRIPGYGRECGTHLAAASLIARRGADFAVGSEKTCRQIAGLDFVPLQDEKYDLVFFAENAEKAPFRALAEIVRSADFREELEGFGGYDTTETGRTFRL